MAESNSPGRLRFAGHGLWAVRFVVLVAFLDLFLQFPIVSPFAESLGSPGPFVGIIVAVYSVTNLTGNVASGFLLDRLGRRGPVLAGLILTSITLATYAAVKTPLQLFAIRAMHGLAASVLAPGAFAIIGDGAASNARARAMGVSGATIAAAATIGPPIAGIMRDSLGFGAVFRFDSALMLGAAVLFWYGTRGAPSQTLGLGSIERRFRAAAIRRVVRPPMMASYLAVLATTVAVGSLVTYLPLALEAQGQPGTRSGVMLGAYALVSMLVMASPMSRISDRRGRARPLAAGLAFAAVGLIALGVLVESSAAMIGMALFGMGFGLVFPAATAQVAESTGPGERGTAFGVLYALYSLGVIVGSVASALIHDWAGGLVGLPFFAVAPLALAATPVVLRYASSRIGSTGPSQSETKKRGLGKA